jgi:hypothetical protein
MAVASTRPVPRVDRVVARWHMPYDEDPVGLRDSMFQSPVRSRALLLIAAAGTIDMTATVELTGMAPVSVLYAVNHWERQRIVRSIPVGTHRLVTLDPNFECATELKALLTILVDNSDEQQALG